MATMDAFTMTRRLEPLLAAGWIDLQPAPGGRTRSVALTAAGREEPIDA